MTATPVPALTTAPIPTLTAALAALSIAAVAGVMLFIRHSPTMLAAALATLTAGLVATVVARQRWLAHTQRRLEFERIKALQAERSMKATMAKFGAKSAAHQGVRLWACVCVCVCVYVCVCVCVRREVSVLDVCLGK